MKNESNELIKLISYKKQFINDFNRTNGFFNGIVYKRTIRKMEKQIRNCIDNLAKQQAEIIYNQTKKFYEDIVEANKY